MISTILTGRLTKDAVLGQTANGTAVAKFTVASDKTRRKSAYHEEPEANFIPVEIYGKKAESLGEYLKKGRAYALTGKIQTDSYKDAGGNTKYAWKVVADNVEFLPGGSMSGMNSVTVVGRLTADAKTSFTKDGMCVLNFTVASDRYSKDKEKSADFIPITLFGKLGESLGRYLVKGKSVSIIGKIDTGSYKNAEGTTVYTWKVIADDIHLNGDGDKEKANAEAPAQTEEQKEAQTIAAEPEVSEPASSDLEDTGFIDLPPEFDEEYFDDEPF